jgi:GGDEF domain-containing protein
VFLYFYGHAAVDRALIAAASVSRQFFYSNDFIARYAGDEFLKYLDKLMYRHKCSKRA